MQFEGCRAESGTVCWRPATNAAITFAHLGGRSTLVTAVGRHSLAGAIKAEIEQRSVTLIDLNPNFSEPPVLSSIYVNRLGQRNIVSANAIRVNVPVVRVDEAALERGALVLVDGHYMQACKNGPERRVRWNSGGARWWKLEGRNR